MKKKFKILGGALSVVILLTLVFGAGVYASQWLSFTGDQQIEQSENDVDEIMQILRDVNADKLTAEEALKELQDLNPSGLAEQNKELRAENKQLKAEINNKQNELDNKQIELNNKQAEIEAKQAEINEKNRAYDALQQERDGYKAELDNSSNYVQHLEQELTRANQKAESVNSKTTEAVEEARSYK